MITPILTKRLPSFLFKWLVFTGMLGLVPFQTKALTVTCPEDVTIQLGPGACGAIVALHTLPFTTTVQLVDTIFFPESNSVFPIGSTPVTMATADINGLIEVCVFNVTVLDFIGPLVYCKSNVQLSLDGACDRLVEPQDVLQLNLNGCLDNFALFRVNTNNTLGPPIITALDIGTSVTIRAIQPFSGKSCDAQVTVLGGTPPSFTCPPDITIVCNLPVDPAYTGAPDLDGCFENVQLSFTDQLTPTGCSDSFAYQIIRQWVSVDPFGIVDMCQQIITAKKFDINLVTFPLNRDGIEAPALTCNDTLTWPMNALPSVSGFPQYNGFSPDLSQHCKISATYLDFATNLCGESWEIRRVWKVVKTCPPFVTLQDTQIIKILDVNAPVFELPDTIFVSESPDCADSLFLPSANVLQECSGYNVVIETPWDTLTTNGGLLYLDSMTGVFQLRYILTDECGNVGIKEPLLLIDGGTLASCPPDTTFNCDYFSDTLNIAIQFGNSAIAALIGNPVYYGNCDFTITEVDSFDINSCGVGTFRRFLTNNGAIDPETCVQTVTVTPVSDFEVLFPENIAICTSLAAAQTGVPQLFNISCENITVSHIDDITMSGVAGCFTVHRTFIVKNTCTFDSVTTVVDPIVDTRRFADGGDGYITYTQTIAVNNTAGPSFTNGCEISDINLTGTNCTVLVNVPTPALASCGGNPTLQVSGDLGTTLGAVKVLPAGEYEVVYQATDDCGKVKLCMTQFEVVDNLVPVAKCANPFQIEPLAELTPLDVNNGSTDNCPNLTYSFASDFLDDSRIFPCCADGIYPVVLWVTDPSGNQDSCHTFVLVEPQSTVCVCDLVIAGNVHTEENEGVANVKVRLNSSSGQADSLVTDGTGNYSFNALPGYDYAVGCEKNTNPVNGVTTFDIVLLTRHVLGVTSLGSPYKIIAADANRSNTVTTFDAVEIRRLILGITTSFTNNTSWRFVKADFVFPNPQNPFQGPFPEMLDLNNLQMDILDKDFIAIKIGDLNNSVDPALFSGFPDGRGNARTASFLIKNQQLETGKEYSLPIRLEQAMAGFQFALSFDKNNFEVTGIEPSIGNMENYVFSNENGHIKASWYAPDFKAREGGTVALTLNIRAKNNGYLQEWLVLDRQAMVAEAYDAQLEIMDAALFFDENTVEQSFELFPARPNPFDKTTLVSFYLPESGETHISVSDVGGKLVWSSRSFYQKGVQELELKKSDLPAAGVYFIKVETKGDTKTQRLVLAE